jgi:predicted RNase H-like HicB family nuclease
METGIEDDLRPEYDLKQLLQIGVKGKYAERCKIQAVVYPGDEGGYVAECLDLAVVTQGKTLDETVENLREAIRLHLEGEDMEEMGSMPTISTEGEWDV